VLHASEQGEKKGSKCETHKEISMKLFSGSNNAILVKGDWGIKERRVL
jgi:hypothetical protein